MASDGKKMIVTLKSLVMKKTLRIKATIDEEAFLRIWLKN
jgi:hypothetical protein